MKKTKLGNGKRKKPQPGKIEKDGFAKSSKKRDKMEAPNKPLGLTKDKTRK